MFDSLTSSEQNVIVNERKERKKVKGGGGQKPQKTGKKRRKKVLCFSKSVSPCFLKNLHVFSRDGFRCASSEVLARCTLLDLSSCGFRKFPKCLSWRFSLGFDSEGTVP